MTLGSKLKKCRNKLNVSIRKAQENTSLNNICRYENDLVKPSFEAVVKMARYYGVSINELEKSV